MSKRMIWRFAFFAITLTAAWVSADGYGRVEGFGHAARFVSDKYGFSIAIPTGWGIDASGNTPFYFSFSPAEGKEFNHFLRLPKGGAVITIIAEEELPGPRSKHERLSDWATQDVRTSADQISAIRPFDMPKETSISRAITTGYDTEISGPDDQSQHNENIF
ncbi:MAG: hypothetical protein WA324_04640 [Bryobacteraceae bacterium]